MNLYKTAISALVLVPIVGGISAKMMYEYHHTLKSAERYAAEYQEQAEQTAALLDQLLEETLNEMPDGAFDATLIETENPDSDSDLLFEPQTRDDTRSYKR